MALENGLYALRYRTEAGTGAGVVYAQDGILRGGNSLMAYLGDYTESEGMIEACVRAYVHTVTPGMAPAFGVDNAVIRLKGVVDGPNVIFSGSSAQAPGVTLSATMERLHD